MIPFALEHTIEQHVTITIIYDSMKRTIRYQDHISGSNSKWLVSFVA
jgi:hypothetical protein